MDLRLDLASLQALDESLLRTAKSAPPALAVAFLVLTHVGGGFGLLALLPLVRLPRFRAAFAWIVLTAGLTALVVSSLKALFGRARPCDALDWCKAELLASPGGGSFPSGHAAGAFAFAAFLVARFGPRGLFALPFAAGVAWSRCVLGVHYPSDVFAGALLGAGMGAAFGRAARKDEEAPLRALAPASIVARAALRAVPARLRSPWRSGSRRRGGSRSRPEGSGSSP